jgi:hypothetical protein
MHGSLALETAEAMHGMAEFLVPQGAKISAVGLRAKAVRS